MKKFLALVVTLLPLVSCTTFPHRAVVDKEYLKATEKELEGLDYEDAEKALSRSVWMHKCAINSTAITNVLVSLSDVRDARRAGKPQPPKVLNGQNPICFRMYFSCAEKDDAVAKYYGYEVESGKKKYQADVIASTEPSYHTYTYSTPTSSLTYDARGNPRYIHTGNSVSTAASYGSSATVCSKGPVPHHQGFALTLKSRNRKDGSEKTMEWIAD